MESLFLNPEKLPDVWEGKQGVIEIYEVTPEPNRFNTVHYALDKIMIRTGKMPFPEVKANVTSIIGKSLHKIAMNAAQAAGVISVQDLTEHLGLYLDYRAFTEASGTCHRVMVTLDSPTNGAAKSYVKARHWESAGGFSTKLGDAWDVADSKSKTAIALAFPQLARAAQIQAVLDGSYVRWLQSCAS